MTGYVTVTDERGHPHQVPLWKLPELCAAARDAKQTEIAKAQADAKAQAEAERVAAEAAARAQVPDFSAANPFTGVTPLGVD